MTESEVFYPLAHSPKLLQQPDMVHLKPGVSASSPMWVQGPGDSNHPLLLSPAQRT